MRSARRTPRASVGACASPAAQLCQFPSSHAHTATALSRLGILSPPLVIRAHATPGYVGRECITRGATLLGRHLDEKIWCQAARSERLCRTERPARAFLSLLRTNYAHAGLVDAARCVKGNGACLHRTYTNGKQTSCGESTVRVKAHDTSVDAVEDSYFQLGGSAFTVL